MRIGHYAPHLWAQGGIATYVRRLGAAQAAAGHEVAYLGLDVPAAEVGIQVVDDHDLFRQAWALGLDILHLHKPVRVLPSDRVTTVRTMHGNQGGCPSGTRYLERSGQACERDYSVAGCLWGHLVDHCGSRRPKNILANFDNIRWERWLASQVRTCVVSTYVKEQMVRAGCPPERLHVLLSPAPDVPQDPAPMVSEGRPRFLFVGRLTPQKGGDWLLRAAAQVGTAIEVDIAGDGPERAALERLADTLGLADRTTFHGWVDAGEVQRLFAGARAVVVPSVWQEPAGLVTLEAAAAGRPVIASRVGGIPEYARAFFASTIPPRDVGRLAEAMARLADDADLAWRLGTMGRTMTRTRFAMHRFIKDLAQLYELAIAEDDVNTLAEPVADAPTPEDEDERKSQNDEYAPGAPFTKRSRGSRGRELRSV
jgi:glycosyltransferase involved in cell wall biosynthesis